MRRFTACSALLLLPLSALANDAPCRFTENRELALDLRDARTVVFEVNQHDLRLQAGNGPAHLSGRACASNADWLKQLTLTQRHQGNKLVVSLRREGRSNTLPGNDYAWLDIRGGVPADVVVQIKTGSGEAHVEGARALSVDLGSGDVTALRTGGSVHAAVGSGDLMVDGAGSVELLSLGSGDAKLRNVKGDVTVGSLGSGDLEVRSADGNLRIGTIGSGDAEIRQVRGNADIDLIGSGDVDLRDIGGNVRVGSHGSGNVEVQGAGALVVERSGSGDVRHRDVRGNINLPRGK